MRDVDKVCVTLLRCTDALISSARWIASAFQNDESVIVGGFSDRLDDECNQMRRRAKAIVDGRREWSEVKADSELVGYEADNV